MTRPSPPAIVAVVGMTREAKILAGVPAVVGGGMAATLTDRLVAALNEGAAGVISFGLCGALDPALEVGDLVIGQTVSWGDERIDIDSAWRSRLASALPAAKVATIAATDRPVATPQAKAELHRLTSAAATDMETGLAAKIAQAGGVPFAVLRAVSDSAHRALPAAAEVGLGPQGDPAFGPVLAALARKPWQLPSLVRTGLEAEVGFRALVRARHLLGPGLAGPDLG